MTRSDGFAAREKEREAAEGALLGRLRERRAALGELLAGSSDHGGYEDPVYRFYHQSFKVYYIQEQTKSIVAALTGLAPDRPLGRSRGASGSCPRRVVRAAAEGGERRVALKRVLATAVAQSRFEEEGYHGRPNGRRPIQGRKPARSGHRL
jgi:hypothetical protein